MEELGQFVYVYESPIFGFLNHHAGLMGGGNLIVISRIHITLWKDINTLLKNEIFLNPMWWRRWRKSMQNLFIWGLNLQFSIIIFLRYFL